MINRRKHTIAATLVLLAVFAILSARFCDTNLNKRDRATTQFNQAQADLEKKYSLKLDLPYFDKCPEDVLESLKVAKEKANAALDDLANTPLAKLNFANTLGRLDTIYYEVGNASNIVGLLAETSTDMDLKKVAKEAEAEMSKWYVDVAARRDIYEVIKAYADTNPQVEGTEARMLEDTMRSYKRRGFDLPEEKFQRVIEIKKQMADIAKAISINIDKANSEKTLITKQEAEGIPADMLESIATNESGDYLVAAGIFSQYQPFNVYSPKEETRKKVFLARQQRAMQSNQELIEKMVRLRAEQAKLLGYDTWADYKTEVMMAKNGKRALDFITDLSEGIEPKFQAELAALSKLKVEDTNDANAKIQAWDFRYYLDQYKKRVLDVDTTQLKKYFEYENTLQGMFRVFERLFSLKIEEIQAPYVWEKKVRLMRIYDSRNGAPLGYLYLDMFPRPDQEKYSHFAQFTLRKGKLLDDGTYRRPIAALVCNFPEATKEGPALLSLDNVETLFHEFGHALHTILTTVNYASISGTSVPRDFVEAPSQMLEYFVLDKEVLDTFAHNYENPNDKVPSDLLERIKKSQNATIATHYRRQFAFAIMDQKIHQEIQVGDATTNLTSFTNQVLKDVFLEFPENTSMISSFGHLWGGYDASYYGYAWADSVAADLASVFEESPQGFNDKEVAMRLRKEIYETGDSRDVNASIEKFLGRDFSIQAFLKRLGISTAN